jgi:hypothetical protein
MLYSQSRYKAHPWRRVVILEPWHAPIGAVNENGRLYLRIDTEASVLFVFSRPRAMSRVYLPRLGL